MSASMSLTLKEGKAVLVIEPMQIETKVEAKYLSAMIEKWAESLPESKPRVRATKGKKLANAARERQAARQSRKPNGDVTDAEATQTSLV